MFFGFTTFTIALSRIGILGMRRRIADYDPTWSFDASTFENWNIAATIGGWAVGFSVLLLLVNLFFYARYGKKAVPNPWRSMGLEWQIMSPPPEFNYNELPEIVGNPYDYGKPGAVYAIVSDSDRADNPPPPPSEPGPIIPKVAAPAPSGD